MQQQTKKIGYAMRVFQMNPFVYGLGTMFGAWLCIGATMRTDYHSNPLLKV